MSGYPENRINYSDAFKPSGVRLCNCLLYTPWDPQPSQAEPFLWTKISQGSMLQVSLQIRRHRPCNSTKLYTGPSQAQNAQTWQVLLGKWGIPVVLYLEVGDS